MKIDVNSIFIVLYLDEKINLEELFHILKI